MSQACFIVLLQGRNYFKEGEGTMKTVLYLGIQNTPIEVEKTVCLGSDYRIHSSYSINGNPIVLRATRNACAYYPPHDCVSYPNHTVSPCVAGQLYPVSVLDAGFSGHDFEVVFS